MTGQEFIDFIRANKAENAEIVFNADWYYLPELPDMEYSRMRITITGHAANELPEQHWER